MKLTSAALPVALFAGMLFLTSCSDRPEENSIKNDSAQIIQEYIHSKIHTQIENNPEHKIFRLGSTGGFYKKTDAPQIKEVFKRHDEELEAAIAADSTGKGFIYEMFLNEMENHEYSYTGDLEETLDAVGYTAEDIEKDKRLSVGLLMAHKRVMRCC